MVHNFLDVRRPNSDYKPVSVYNVMLDANTGNLSIIPASSSWTFSKMSKSATEHSSQISGRKVMYLTTHSTHFIYGYMASDIW